MLLSIFLLIELSVWFIIGSICDNGSYFYSHFVHIAATAHPVLLFQMDSVSASIAAAGRVHSTISGGGDIGGEHESPAALSASMRSSRLGGRYSSPGARSTHRYSRFIVYIIDRWQTEVCYLIDSTFKAVTLVFSDRSPVGCLAHVRMSAIAKCSRYFRRLIRYQHMDFEFAIWQMIYLLVRPQKVYRNFMYRKRMCICKLILFALLLFYRHKGSMGTWWSSISRIANCCISEFVFYPFHFSSNVFSFF